MRILALVLIVACSSKTPAQEQSFHDGVAALCDLPNHVPEPVEPYDKRLAEVSAWAAKNITNPEAKRVGSLESLAANKDALANAAAKAAIQHCLLLDNGMELQSFTDAMKTVCNAGDQGPAYFKSHVLNAEVIRLIESLGAASPAEGRTRLADAVKRAGLTSCPYFEHAATSPVPIPSLSDAAGLVDLEATSTLAISNTAIVIEGKSIVAVTNGDVDPAEKEGGASGIMLPRVRDFTKALAQVRAKQTPGAPLAMTLFVVPTAPYRLLIEVLFSTKTAGFRSFNLAVTYHKAMKAIPLELPDKVPAGKPAKLGMVVSVTKTKVIVWSLSGTEGTLAKPRLSIAPDHLAELQTALAAIVDKHFKGTRTGDDRAIITMFDGALPIQTVAEVIAAVRTTTDGKELFPDVRLSSGFE